MGVIENLLLSCCHCNSLSYGNHQKLSNLLLNMCEKLSYSGPSKTAPLKVTNLLWVTKSYSPTVPNLFGTRDWFHGRQFFHGLGAGVVGGGMVQAVTWVMGSDAEQQLKLHLLARSGVGDPCYSLFLMLDLSVIWHPSSLSP